MDVAPPEVRAGVYLKVERFNLICRILGHTSELTIGRSIGMTVRTVSRAREGIIGERFIASVLKAFGEHEAELAEYGIGVHFEDLFELGDKQVTS